MIRWIVRFILLIVIVSILIIGVIFTRRKSATQEYVSKEQDHSNEEKSRGLEYEENTWFAGIRKLFGKVDIDSSVGAFRDAVTRTKGRATAEVEDGLDVKDTCVLQ